MHRTHRTTALCALALAARAATAAAQPPERPDDRPRFSLGRMAVEILAGAVVGSAVAYGTYESVCSGASDDPCFGAGLAAVGLNFAITPLAVWGAGRWMGGNGTVGMTYLGAAAATSPLTVPGSPDETPAQTSQRVGIELAISTLLLPVTSSLFFELSSNMRWRAAHPDAAFAIAPVRDHGATTGAMAVLSLRF
jgi:hypothetical protein